MFSWLVPAPGAVLLKTNLAEWARRCPLPLALVFDEIDSLVGNSLISVLRQLRAGFPDRPSAFPGPLSPTPTSRKPRNG